METIAIFRVSSPIALALPNIGLGGAEAVNITLAGQFLRRGFPVDIVTAEDVTPKYPIPHGARHIVLDAKRTRKFLLPFARYLRSERPAAVVASMWPFTTACVLARRLARSAAPIIVCEHCNLSEQYGGRGLLHKLMLSRSIGMTYPMAQGRVAVSGGVADDIAAVSGIARDSISVIYNPVPAGCETPVDPVAADALWSGWRGPRIVTVGRLKEQKNHALLIRAFKKLLLTHEARLMIVGAGELAQATVAVARLEGVAGKVLLPGETMDPTPYYRSADVFALSSDYEGFGNVIVEALACGVPVVSTDCRSGPSEILAGGRYGRLVPVGDADALAHAMAEALTATPDRQALKRRAADFAPERIVDDYLKVLFAGTLAGAN